MTFAVRIVGADIAFPCEAGETVLDAAERAGYSIPYSCRKGVCSSCEAALVNGSADVAHEYVHGPREAVLMCRAKPTTDVAIAPKRIEKRGPPARRRIKANVYRVHRPTPDVSVLQLRFPAGTRAKFRAGQYLRVLMPDGDSRNFSMANPPQESDGAQLHIRHVPGGRFSEAVLASLKTGDKLDIELPYGEFFLREDAAKPVVLIATGTGFAPIKSIVEDMIRRGISRPAKLYWGARGKADLYMPALLAKWTAQATWLSIAPVLSEAGPDWPGRRGLVHRAVLDDVPDLSLHQVYACGNPLMIKAARDEFGRIAKLPENEFYADPFVASSERESST
jgi:NAD(P)H-flavin reductase/ferredoxin